MNEGGYTPFDFLEGGGGGEGGVGEGGERDLYCGRVGLSGGGMCFLLILPLFLFIFLNNFFSLLSEKKKIISLKSKK